MSYLPPTLMIRTIVSLLGGNDWMFDVEYCLLALRLCLSINETRRHDFNGLP
jgi:hypothetical protein